jgi:hypothetical protein
MKCFYIFLFIVLFPVISFSETIFLKDSTIIITNIYWEENNQKIGYFSDGKAKYISKDLIDWKKTEEKNSLVNTKKYNINSSSNKEILDGDILVGEMNLYLKSLNIIAKYGSPETLSETNDYRWVAFFPKGDFTIITDKKRNRILRVIDGKGIQ